MNRSCFIFVFMVFFLSGFSSLEASDWQETAHGFDGVKASLWGEVMPGIMRHVEVGEGTKPVALTLDACGGKTGSGYDAKLIDFLREKGIRATLFLAGRWIEANPEIAAELASDPLFEVEDHGMMHRPCSVEGRSVYGLKGTGSPLEAAREIVDCADLMERSFGRRPLFYRSGTAYYDDVAVELAAKLGFRIAGYSVLGDAGATFSQDRVASQVLSSRPGDIILCHMNHPEKETAEGLIKSLPVLLERGYTFVQLSDQPVTE